MASKSRASGGYVQESFQELRKVTWPTKQQAVRLTALVLGFCFVATIILGIIDFGLNQAYRGVVLSTPEPQPTLDLGEVQVTPSTETEEDTSAPTDTPATDTPTTEGEATPDTSTPAPTPETPSPDQEATPSNVNTDTVNP